MATVNQRLQREAVRHAIETHHYSNATVRKMIAVLNRSDARLAAELQSAMSRLPSNSFTTERLDAMLKSVRKLNKAAFDAVQNGLNDELRSFVAYESGYQKQMLASAFPVQVNVAAIPAEQVYTAAMNRPFQGRLLREAWSDVEAGRMKAVRRSIAQGYVENKTTPQIVQEILGTRKMRYADGIVNKSRREVETVVRTALGHYAGVTRDRFVAANTDLIKAVRWVSTLDMRTTKEFCIPRDGLLYEPVTHKPIGHSYPWGAGAGRIHFSCRSTSAPVTKSWRELGLDMDEVPAGTRASMDGQVPSDLSYADWLKDQSAARQDEVLGPTRGKLLREGKLPMDRMYDHKGRFLNLDQLRERDAEAFKRAGLN